MREQWRYVYVGLMILCSCHPDASPVTMILMFAALILLYSCSGCARYVIIARDGKAALSGVARTTEQHELDKI